MNFIARCLIRKYLKNILYIRIVAKSEFRLMSLALITISIEIVLLPDDVTTTPINFDLLEPGVRIYVERRMTR
jgi:hypothetical protein